MKLLMFYTNEWWYKTVSRTLEDVPAEDREEAMTAAIVVFFPLRSRRRGQP